MTTVLALTSDPSGLAELQQNFADEVANGTASIGGVVGVFTGDDNLAQRLLASGSALAVTDGNAISALTNMLDAVVGDPGMLESALSALLGPAASQLDPESVASLGGWLMQFSPGFDSLIQGNPVSDEDAIGEQASCVLTSPPPPPPPQSPLRATRFAGDPVLEACLGGTHRMMAPEEGIAVVKVQAALIDLGFALPMFGADGKFGDETGQAVTAFKTREQLSPNDPVVGPGTMGRLDAFFA
jgi:hypothetical protein